MSAKLYQHITHHTQNTFSVSEPWFKTLPFVELTIMQGYANILA